ncbi:MAG: hypothetical protein EXS36_04540 [Pedosphaera sp.]|nr:hypothetical protein [Pedosphaera sp.]
MDSIAALRGVMAVAFPASPEYPVGMLQGLVPFARIPAPGYSTGEWWLLLIPLHLTGASPASRGEL